MKTSQIIKLLAKNPPATMPPELIEEIHQALMERDNAIAALDFIENHLVGYGTGYGIEHNEMTLQDKYANEFSAYGKDIFECIEDGKRLMKELEEDYK